MFRFMMTEIATVMAQKLCVSTIEIQCHESAYFYAHKFGTDVKQIYEL